jgi:ABC-type branched-subunit amino acid transport system substrate-binding protein
MAQDSATDLECRFTQAQRELSEALEQQAATAGVLRAISNSPTDVQSALGIIAESAAQLLDVTDAKIMLVEGDVLRCVAKHGASRQWPVWSVRPINRNWVTGRAVVDRVTVHVPDLQAAGSDFPQGAAYARQYGHRTTLATPLLREGNPIGAILIRRMDVRPLSVSRNDTDIGTIRRATMRYASLIGLLCAGLLLNGSADAQRPGGGVRIGILNDQSGPYADFGGKTSVDAARMAVEEMGGKVMGKSIEIIVGDHQNKPDIASAPVRRWFDVDGVSAVAELTNSAVALAVQQIAKEQGRITLSTGPATTRLTNEDCSPTGFHWAFDTYSQAVGTARAIISEGGKSWFLLVADYAFGHQMANDLNKVVKSSGGTVVGEVRHPLNTSDFSSFLLRAQSSKAQIIGLASAGADTINSVKQAAEYRIAAGGQKLAGLVVVISDIHALGLATANGLIFTTASIGIGTRRLGFGRSGFSSGPAECPE